MTLSSRSYGYVLTNVWILFTFKREFHKLADLKTPKAGSLAYDSGLIPVHVFNLKRPSVLFTLLFGEV